MSDFCLIASIPPPAPPLLVCKLFFLDLRVISLFWELSLPIAKDEWFFSLLLIVSKVWSYPRLITDGSVTLDSYFMFKLLTVSVESLVCIYCEDWYLAASTIFELFLRRLLLWLPWILLVFLNFFTWPYRSWRTFSILSALLFFKDSARIY